VVGITAGVVVLQGQVAAGVIGVVDHARAARSAAAALDQPVQFVVIERLRGGGAAVAGALVLEVAVDVVLIKPGLAIQRNGATSS
jgi:hypothetical protein